VGKKAATGTKAGAEKMAYSTPNKEVTYSSDGGPIQEEITPKKEVTSSSDGGPIQRPPPPCEGPSNARRLSGKPTSATDKGKGKMKEEVIHCALAEVL